ncbi:hypothetical protein BDP27DRAFT_1493297 [Rhodocollybia butyracea]|uniref:Uncharacterized protein n=1 Tax=Rhodocollybia butyracea TaxID=206335 RepID=A0A9P5PBW6_9AGAR|nr:hypothetical protein BDP27DRAFT_1493297 [Rhodocollybia butyracea]
MIYELLIQKRLYAFRQRYKLSTLFEYGSSSVPIYQTATFKGVGNEYDCSRKHYIAKTSSASHAFAVSSDVALAALDVILWLLEPTIYTAAPTAVLTFIRSHVGVTVHHVDTTDSNTVIPYIHTSKTAMVFLESPTNPLLKVADLALTSREVKFLKERAPANRALEQLDNGSDDTVDREWFTAIAASVDIHCYKMTERYSSGSTISIIFTANGTSRGYRGTIRVCCRGDTHSKPRQGEQGDTDSHSDELDAQLIEAITRWTAGRARGGEEPSEERVACVASYAQASDQPPSPPAQPPHRHPANPPTKYGTNPHIRGALPSLPARALRARASADTANRCPFIAEKVLHGNPERGPGLGRRVGWRDTGLWLSTFPVDRLQSSSKLVAGVGLMKQELPEVVGAILEAIENTSSQAKRSSADSSEFGRENLLRDLSALINENHKQLVSLGVSHPSLETIREKTAASPCGFDPYLTLVGGSGLGIFTSLVEHRSFGVGGVGVSRGQGQVNPPETPDEPEDVPANYNSIRASFESKPVLELREEQAIFGGREGLYEMYKRKKPQIQEDQDFQSSELDTGTLYPRATGQN